MPPGVEATVDPQGQRPRLGWSGVELVLRVPDPVEIGRRQAEPAAVDEGVMGALEKRETTRQGEVLEEVFGEDRPTSRKGSGSRMSATTSTDGNSA
jgi:hypothetical protein